MSKTPFLPQKIESLESELRDIKDGRSGKVQEIETEQEIESELQPATRSRKADGKIMKYSAEHDRFSCELGYCQIRGVYSQDNCKVEINHRILTVTGSYGHACLCCSVAFHLSLVVRPTFKPELFTSLHIDHITMQGKQAFVNFE